MPFSFFHLPREVRDRIYCNLRIVGTSPIERQDHDDDEVIKAAIDIKPDISHLTVSKRFKNEYVAMVFSNATLALGSISSIHPQKTPVLPNLILDHVKTCKINLFIPYEAHKLQKEVQLNTICNSDMFLDLPIEGGEPIADILDLDDDLYEEREDVEDLSDSEIEWEDAAEELDSSDVEEEQEDFNEEQNALTPDWLFHFLSKLRVLQSVELVVTSGEPMPASKSDGPADDLQLIAAELKDLLRAPFLAKLEARRVVVEEYGFHDTKFAGVQPCGVWTAEFGWKIPEEVGVLRGGELELPVKECPGWRCGDPTCLGAGNKHPVSANHPYCPCFT